MELRSQRWLPVTALILAVVGLIMTQSILATRGTVEITQPEQGETVRGLVEIRGSASDENLAYYQMEYSAGGREWAAIGPEHRTRPVRDGVLAVWDTSQVTPGKYQLRLNLTDQMGNRIQNTIEVIVGAE